MSEVLQKSLSSFFMVGISYEKADSAIRSLYAVNDKAYDSLIAKAKTQNIPEIFVLSTCNRTEVYGFAENADQFIVLLCEITKQDEKVFRELAYIYQDHAAIKHLYHVAAGLNSQILGDYEIISQVKNAAQFAREHHALGTFTERLICSVLQVSKQIKNETGLSSGTVSVAFAAVQYLKHIPDINQKKVVLFGTGKIGRNTCKNLISYFNTDQITLINRTNETAKEFAENNHLTYAPIKQLSRHLDEADIILVATNAETPTIRKQHFATNKPRIILDLSIPHNVEQSVKTIPGIQVINVDELSQVQDKTLILRKKEIPKAAAIIEEQMQDFLYWYKMRKHAVVLQAVKKRIEKIHSNEIKSLKKNNTTDLEDIDAVSSRIVQKMVNVFAGKLRQANGQADNYLQVLSEIFEIPVKE